MGDEGEENLKEMKEVRVRIRMRMQGRVRLLCTCLKMASHFKCPMTKITP